MLNGTGEPVPFNNVQTALLLLLIAGRLPFHYYLPMLISGRQAVNYGRM